MPYQIIKSILINEKLTFDMLANEKVNLAKLFAIQNYALQLVSELELIYDSVESHSMKKIVNDDINNVLDNMSAINDALNDIGTIQTSYNFIENGYEFCLN